MKEFFKKNAVWLALFLLAAVVGVLTHNELFSARNITNLVRQVSVNGILACGMTMVILTGGIDLSIGSVLGLAGIVVGISQLNWGYGDKGLIGAFISLGVGLLSGGVVGFINGGLISFLGIAPFVITLGMMVIARGLAMIFSNGSGISPMGDAFVDMSQSYLSSTGTYVVLALIIALVLYRARQRWVNAVFPLAGLVAVSYAFIDYKGFPFIALFLVISIFISFFILEKTPLGRGIYAVGSNQQAAHWAGIHVKKVKWVVYSLMGLLTGLAATLTTARQNGASPNAGELAELDAIAAVVIGGTSLKGGTGSVTGSLVGALIIGLLNNGMDLLQVSSFYQMVFKGVIIIIAVSLDRAQHQEAT